MSSPIFDSKDLRYKSPYGAVPSGTQVSFTLRPSRAEGFSRASLLAWFEFRENLQVTVPMPWVGLEDGCDLFSAALDTSGYTGLIWYRFRLEGMDGKFTELETHQLTVYDGNDQVPDWFGAGVCYQIFPDRFYRSRIPDPTGMVGGRTVHQCWEEQPLFQDDLHPTNEPVITNRDFFGGDFQGILEKLDYIASLGVETIYFCPIFEAAENHRYGTADYHRVDPMLGSNEDFSRLCQEAHKRGIRVMLDGVFNHTGFTSRYFNGDGYYPEPGALQSKRSPYYSWFDWRHWPDDYDSWWGIRTLPAVNEHDPSYRAFIFGDEDSVVRRWLRAGADGWRLDVADELPDDFVAGIHAAAREENPNAVVIGEVWEDGSTKIAYGVRRRHLLGNHLDGLMNYPFRTALIGFLLGGSGAAFRDAMEQLRENYPPFAFYSAMNALGTHDTLRILTYLGVGGDMNQQTKRWRANYRMSDQELRRGISLLKLATMVLFTFPGAPTVFYGDEAGATGFEDPFNRCTYPWGHENLLLLEWYRALGQLRKTTPALRSGALAWGSCDSHTVSFLRTLEEERLATAVNAGSAVAEITIPWPEKDAVNVLTGEVYPAVNGVLHLLLPPVSGVLLRGRATAQYTEEG